MALNYELLAQLAASNNANAVEEIACAARAIGDHYGLSVECVMTIGQVICIQREKAVQLAMEAALMVMKDALGGVK